MDDKDARVSSPVTVRSLVDGGTEQDRLAAVDSLQWVSTNLGEERIGLDFSRHGLSLEIERFGGVLEAAAGQLDPQRVPEGGIDPAHFRQIVHRQAHPAVVRCA